MGKKLDEPGVGLRAPSLALALIGNLRELDRIGTGNGGAAEPESFAADGALFGLRARSVWAAAPLEMRAVRRMLGSFAA